MSTARHSTDNSGNIHAGLQLLCEDAQRGVGPILAAMLNGMQTGPEALKTITESLRSMINIASDEDARKAFALDKHPVPLSLLDKPRQRLEWLILANLIPLLAVPSLAGIHRDFVIRGLQVIRNSLSMSEEGSMFVTVPSIPPRIRAFDRAIFGIVLEICAFVRQKDVVFPCDCPIKMSTFRRLPCQESDPTWMTLRLGSLDDAITVICYLISFVSPKSDSTGWPINKADEDLKMELLAVVRLLLETFLPNGFIAQKDLNGHRTLTMGSAPIMQLYQVCSHCVLQTIQLINIDSRLVPSLARSLMVILHHHVTTVADRCNEWKIGIVNRQQTLKVKVEGDASLTKDLEPRAINYKDCRKELPAMAALEDLLAKSLTEVLSRAFELFPDTGNIQEIRPLAVNLLFSDQLLLLSEDASGVRVQRVLFLLLHRLIPSGAFSDPLGAVDYILKHFQHLELDILVRVIFSALEYWRDVRGSDVWNDNYTGTGPKTPVTFARELASSAKRSTDEFDQDQMQNGNLDMKGKRLKRDSPPDLLSIESSLCSSIVSYSQPSQRPYKRMYQPSEVLPRRSPSTQLLGMLKMLVNTPTFSQTTSQGSRGIQPPLTVDDLKSCATIVQVWAMFTLKKGSIEEGKDVEQLVALVEKIGRNYITWSLSPGMQNAALNDAYLESSYPLMLDLIAPLSMISLRNEMRLLLICLASGPWFPDLAKPELWIRTNDTMDIDGMLGEQQLVKAICGVQEGHEVLTRLQGNSEMLQSCQSFQSQKPKALRVMSTLPHCPELEIWRGHAILNTFKGKESNSQSRDEAQRLSFELKTAALDALIVLSTHCPEARSTVECAISSLNLDEEAEETKRALSYCMGMISCGFANVHNSAGSKFTYDPPSSMFIQQWSCPDCDSSTEGVVCCPDAVSKTERLEIKFLNPFKRLIPTSITMESRLALLQGLSRVFSHLDFVDEEQKPLDLRSFDFGKYLLNQLCDGNNTISRAAADVVERLAMKAGVALANDPLGQTNFDESLTRIYEVIARGFISLSRGQTGAWPLQLSRRILRHLPEDHATYHMLVIKLIDQAFAESIFIRAGFIFDQLSMIAEDRGISNFRLVQPQMEFICACVIQKLEAGQDGWLESVFYPWTGLSSTRFLQQNLSELVPKMILLNSGSLIEKVAAALNEKVGGLCIRQIDHILAAIFLQLEEQNFQPCIELLRGLIIQIEDDMDGTLARSLDIVELTTLSIEGLLCCLSAELGNEDAAKRDKARTTIEIVESYAWKRMKLGAQGKAVERPSLAVFLRRHVLAIMSEVNSVILDRMNTMTLRTKAKTLRSLILLVHMLNPIQSSVLSQIFSPLNIALDIRGLRIHALHAINGIVNLVDAKQLDVMLPHIFQTLTKRYSESSTKEKGVILRIFEHLVFHKQDGLQNILPEVGALPNLPEFLEMNNLIQALKENGDFEHQIRLFIKRSGNENEELAEQALLELTQFLKSRTKELLSLVATKEPQIDPVLRELIHALLTGIGRFRGSDAPVPRRCVECLGIIGAIDPAKLSAMRMIPTPPALVNFHDPEDAKNFVCEMIEVQLVGKTRSIGDIHSEAHWAYTLQTLLAFCGITKGALNAEPSRPHGHAARQPSAKSPGDRWRAFPRHVQEVLELLIDAKYTKAESTYQRIHPSPLYPRVETFKDWITTWVLDLIGKVTSRYAKDIFQACKHVVPYDTNTCLYILPHLVLTVLVDGSDKDREEIVSEMGTVLGNGHGWRQDGADKNHGAIQQHSGELRQLGSQTVFALYDHIVKWIQTAKNLSAKSSVMRYTTTADVPQPFSMRQQDIAALEVVQAQLTSISNDIIAMAAFRAKAYARALLHYEQYVRETRQNRGIIESDVQTMYEKYQEIYVHMEEPDGMEGISTMITSGTRTQNLLQCESAGRWSEAQSYYELGIQEEPEKFENHAGLYKCLENLGHYNTLLSTVEGDIKDNPDWEQQLTEWRVSSAWKVQNWDSLEAALSRSVHASFDVGLGQLLLDMRENRVSDFEKNLQHVRSMMIAPLAAASMESYQRAYEHIVRLHMLHELEEAFKIANERFEIATDHVMLEPHQINSSFVHCLREYQPALDVRFESMAPSFRLREQVSTLRRIAFYTICIPDTISHEELSFLNASCGELWLQSARMARKYGHGQASYAAMLNAESLKNRSATIERAKYEFIHNNERQAIKTIDLTLSRTMPGASALQSSGTRALSSTRLRQASNSVHRAPSFNTELMRVYDHVVNTNDTGYIRAKAHLLRTRWMDRGNLVSPNEILEGYRQATVEADRWEKGYYFAGQYFLKLYENSKRYKNRIPTFTHMTNACRLYGKALTLGPKYLFQALPRLLTFWLELGQLAQGRPATSPVLQASAATEFQNVNKLMQNLSGMLPEYMFLSAFPQIISRMFHKNTDAFAVLQHIIANVVLAFPHQAIWQMVSVSRSIVHERKRVCNKILDSIQFQPLIGSSVMGQIKEALDLCDNLITLCMAAVPDKVDKLSLQKNFPKVYTQLGENYNLTVPCQATMWPSIPESSATMASHQSFKSNLPKINRFLDEVEVMSSLQRPRKITIVGSDGVRYTFLCKPKDDLRKDAKVMEFNGLVNMLLQRNRGANRKNLYIRTYSVIPLNEECGLIEWVHNTIPFRHIMQKQYKMNNISMPSLPEIKRILDHEDHVRMFVKDLLPKFPPVFHQWLLDISKEPTAWFETRLRYTRTTAVMSMAGHVMGLGDRHGENLLFDHRNGDIVHVDFNCLFEQGKTFPKPERVPFRLTQNMVDAMGLAGYEGVYRLACEQTLSVFRDNMESLVSVLEGFLHDPLVEWAKSKRRGQQIQLDPRQNVAGDGGAVPGALNDGLGGGDGAVPGVAEETRARLRTRNEQKAKADAAAAAAAAAEAAADLQQNEKAQTILAVIKRKLNGTESLNAYVLSVQGQVEELIQTATNAENLSKMYIGWSAYL